MTDSEPLAGPGRSSPAAGNLGPSKNQPHTFGNIRPHRTRTIGTHHQTDSGIPVNLQSSSDTLRPMSVTCPRCPPEQNKPPTRLRTGRRLNTSVHRPPTHGTKWPFCSAERGTDLPHPPSPGPTARSLSVRVHGGTKDRARWSVASPRENRRGCNTMRAAKIANSRARKRGGWGEVLRSCTAALDISRSAVKMRTHAVLADTTDNST